MGVGDGEGRQAGHGVGYAGPPMHRAWSDTLPLVPGGLKHAPLARVMAAPTHAPGSKQDATPKSLSVTPVPSGVQSRRVDAMPGSRRALQAPAASVTRGELVPPHVVLRVKTDTATVRGAGGAPPQ